MNKSDITGEITSASSLKIDTGIFLTFQFLFAILIIIFFNSKLVDCRGHTIYTGFIWPIKLIGVEVEAEIWDCKFDAILPK